MKVKVAEQTVELTRRNLTVLLAKLDGHPKNSFCTISNDGWYVTAVEDAEHYSDRRAGEMHPVTEAHVVVPAPNPAQLTLFDISAVTEGGPINGKDSDET